MTHWGWYWKVKKQHKSKLVCDYFIELDSFIFLKNNRRPSFFVEDENRYFRCITLDEYLEISTEIVNYVIPYEKQPCHFGGFRYFFRCPLQNCNRRMRKLYYYRGVFACRKCLNLCYFSQTVKPSWRLSFQNEKIHKKLKKLGGSIFDKPKWMRWKTFDKLLEKERAYEWKSEMAQHEEFYQMFGFYP